MNEIMDILNTIDYGFKDEKGFNLIEDDNKWNEFEEFYYLQTPEELLNTKCGVCWDQVELERKLFLENGEKIKTYFIYIQDQDMLPSHTFLVINNNIWFEHSWYNHRGIHTYKNLQELLDDVTNKFIAEKENLSKDAKIYLFEYNTPPTHIKCMPFYDYIHTQKLIFQKNIK